MGGASCETLGGSHARIDPTAGATARVGSGRYRSMALGRKK
jgi:hypothetical protein